MENPPKKGIEKLENWEQDLQNEWEAAGSPTVDYVDPYTGLISTLIWVVGVGLVVLATGAIALTLQDLTGSNYKYCIECSLSSTENYHGLTAQSIWEGLAGKDSLSEGWRRGVFSGQEIRIIKNPIKRSGYEWDYKVFSHSKVFRDKEDILLVFEDNPHYSKVRKTVGVVDTKLNTLADKIAEKVAAKVLENRKKKEQAPSSERKGGKVGFCKDCGSPTSLSADERYAKNYKACYTCWKREKEGK